MRIVSWDAEGADEPLPGRERYTGNTVESGARGGADAPARQAYSCRRCLRALPEGWGGWVSVPCAGCTLAAIVPLVLYANSSSREAQQFATNVKFFLPCMFRWEQYSKLVLCSPIRP